MAKVISFKTACQLSRKFKGQGKKVIFTSGCFDVLHFGHIRFLKKVRDWGGLNSVIFVGLESDGYLKANKGSQRPIFKQRARAEVLSGISLIDYVILFKNEWTAGQTEKFTERYKDISPDIVVIGNTERLILKLSKRQAKKADCEFKYFSSYPKYESSSRIAKLILDSS